MKILRVLFIAIKVAILIYIASSYYFAYLFTSPHNTSIFLPEDFEIYPEDVSITTSDDIQLKGWLFRNVNSDACIVLLHGWKANRYETLPRVKFLYEMGYNVFIYDARACGESTGDEITIGYKEAEDIIAVSEFLKNEDMNSIACIGISQGAATIVYANSAIKNLKCIILESMYDDVSNAIDNRYRKYFYVGGYAGYFLKLFAENKVGVNINEMKPIERINQLKVPVFIISGDNDKNVLTAETLRIYKKANEQKRLWIVEGAAHEDLFKYNQSNYQNNVFDFLNEYLK